ncbi:hypothetical protein CRUP_005535, partial [Coryphaenoides rupestris]
SSSPLLSADLYQFRYYCSLWAAAARCQVQVSRSGLKVRRGPVDNFQETSLLPTIRTDDVYKSFPVSHHFVLGGHVASLASLHVFVIVCSVARVRGAAKIHGF